MNKSIVEITQAKLSGTIKVPSSKSLAHRAIICSVLSFDKSNITNIDLSEDILATINAFKTIGVKFNLDGHTLFIDSTNINTKDTVTIDCNESGSTLRFLIPVFAALSVKAIFKGKGRLPERPLDVYLEALSKAGVRIHKKINKSSLPLSIESKLSAGEFYLPGDVSSQFISGLLLALPLLGEDSYVYLSSPLESKSYVDMTIDTLKKYNINIEIIKNGFKVPKNQVYKKTSFKVESDFSQAAFFLASNLLSSNVNVAGLNINSIQGDKYILKILENFGAKINIKDDIISIEKKDKINPININISQTPDLLPIVSVLCCFGSGISKIYGARRLRFKESDRLSAIANAINCIGGQVSCLDDGLIISPIKGFHGGKVDGCNDHRIVMAMAVAGTMADSKITISDALSVNKSYPNFFRDYNMLGGNANVINIR